MSQSEKSSYFQALKAAGVQFEKHYREYTTDYLRQSYDRLVAEGVITPPAPMHVPTEVVPSDLPGAQVLDSTQRFAEAGPAPEQQSTADPSAAAFFGYDVEPVQSPAAAPTPAPQTVPVSGPPRNELAGARQNAVDAGEVIRVDELTGRKIIQEEVKKPAYPKSRGRRVLKYMDTGVQKQTVKAGDYTEEFEIPGDPANARPAEVRITLPSYQVGISIDPRFPMFKIITYNGNEGFDLFDVQKFYGGAELVPAEIKRKYVENTLCYDIRTVVRAIETEYRQLVLAKGRA